MQISEQFKEYVDTTLEQFDNLDTANWVSKPIVMASAAGWYVGRVCIFPEDGLFLQPYSRESGYMSEQDALKYYLQQEQEADLYQEVYCDVCGMTYDADEPCPYH